MGVRKNQATLTASEKARYIAAVRQLKANGDYDRYVAQHREAMQSPMMPAHMMPAFLTWHREYLRRFEIDLQSIDPSVTVPYWDWTADRLPNASLWAPDFMGGDGEPGSRRVITGPFAFSTDQWTLTVTSPDAPGSALRRTLGQPFGLPTASQVNAALGIVPYDSPPWMRSSPGFRSRLEGLHNVVHPWVGGPNGSMGGPTSPNDPVFFLHHAFIDRLWAQWQTLHPDRAFYLPTVGGPQGHNLNDPMSPWGGSATPASVINHRALGYSYDTEPVDGEEPVGGIVDLTVGAPPVQTSIGRAGEVDIYRFPVPAAGNYRIETQGPTDVLMSLFGPNSPTALVTEDDDSGQDRNARIVTRLTAGAYFLRIRHYQPSSTGSYGILVAREAAAPPIREIPVNGPAIQGNIEAANESDLYTFSAGVTGIYTIATQGNTDTFLSLFGPNSQNRLILQDDDSGPGFNSRIVADLAAGAYFVRVLHYEARGTGLYRLSVRR